MTAALKVRKLAVGVAATIVASAIAFFPDRAPAGNLTAVNSGRSDLTVFLLDGPIVGGETLALERLIAALPPSKSIAVILNSPGGITEEGFALGRFFYRARIATFVLGYGGFCHSACALAFLGGRDNDAKPSRTKMSGGGLGFHQFRRLRSAAESAMQYTKTDMENEADTTRAIALHIIQYLSDIGENMSVLHLMLKAPTEELTLLSNEDAATYGINVMDEHDDQIIDSMGIRVRIEAR